MTTRYVMGTFLAVSAAGPQADPAREALLVRIQALEERLSFFREDSDLTRVNRAAGLHSVEVSPEAFEAVACALRLAEKTEGAFDPTFRSERPDFRRVRLEGRSVFLPHTGMLLDLGAIGKGFALDLALTEVSSDYEIDRMTLNFGGQLQFWSRSGRFEPEAVAVEDPRGGPFLASFSVDGDCSVSTSSQAQRPGHLLDPRSGRIVSGCLSATAVARTGAEAEALSTALFVLGRPAAQGLLERFPGARAILH